jgi:exportin-2 (importin alpha re-exporter)
MTQFQQLVNSFSPSDYNINIGVLETAHSIFRPWRSAVRSNELFTTINLVLNKFMPPYLALLQKTTESIFTTPTELTAQAEVLLIQLFYDLTCQDLPPAIEDANEQFFAPNTGLFHRFLAWDNEQLRGDVTLCFCVYPACFDSIFVAR